MKPNHRPGYHSAQYGEFDFDISRARNVYVYNTRGESIYTLVNHPTIIAVTIRSFVRQAHTPQVPVI